MSQAITEVTERTGRPGRRTASVKKALTGIAGALLATASVVAVAPSAQAAEGFYRFENQYSGKCLKGAGDGSRNVVSGTCRTGADLWFTDVHAGRTQFKNSHLNLCLDHPLKSGPVYLSPCNAGDEGQWWGVRGNEDGTGTIGPANSERMLVGWADGSVATAYDFGIDDIRKARYHVS